MNARFFRSAAVSLLALAACTTTDVPTGDGFGTGHSGTGGGTAATVQIVNVTGGALDVATNGVVGAGNAGISFGGASACTSINAASSGLTIRPAGTTSPFGNFTPTFQAGRSYTVVAYLDAAGTTQFATLLNTFTPGSGQAGLRVFNAAASSGSFDAYVTPPGASLGAPAASAVPFGAGSSFFNVPGGTSQLRFTNAGTSTVSLDAGTTSLTTGQTSTVVIGPPAFSGTGLRSFIAPGC
jgi:Domain of unknown function (DUF4397)